MHYRSWLAVLTISGLSVVASAATWEMFAFRHDLHAITENVQWEQRLEEQGVYRQGTILFFGDSEIAHWRMALSFGSMPIRNRGVKGDWAHRALHRYAEDLRTFKPRLVVLLIGTNDMANHQSMESTLADIDRMVSAAPHVVLCSILPVRGEYLMDHPASEIVRWNEALRALAARRGARFVDLYRAVANERGEFRSEFTVDGLHPSPLGYAVMTQTIMPFLN